LDRCPPLSVQESLSTRKCADHRGPCGGLSSHCPAFRVDPHLCPIVSAQGWTASAGLRSVVTFRECDRGVGRAGSPPAPPPPLRSRPSHPSGATQQGAV